MPYACSASCRQTPACRSSNWPAQQKLRSRVPSRRSATRIWPVRAKACTTPTSMRIRPLRRRDWPVLAFTRCQRMMRDQEVLFAPFRARTAHVVIFGPVSCDWPVPGGTQKRNQGADGTAERGNENGGGERKSCHVMLHAKRESELAG